MAINVTGLTVDKILSMDMDDLNDLTRADLSKVVGRLVSAGNKRLRRLEKAGVESPALRGVYQSGGVFSTKGKNEKQLIREFTRIKTFYGGKTSSVKGARQYTAKFKDLTKGMNKDQVKTFFDTLHKLREVDRTTYEFRYEELVDETRIAVESGTDEPQDVMLQRLQQLYEENIGEENVFNEFYEI